MNGYAEVVDYINKIKRSAQTEESEDKGFRRACAKIEMFCCEKVEKDFEYRKDFKRKQSRKIRELFENNYQKVLKVIKKQTGNWRGMPHVEIETAGTITICESGKEFWCTSSVKIVPTNIDPMPWEDEYEIEL